jgi:chromosome segregation ATPase
MAPKNQEPPRDELIARFQLETEQRLAAIQAGFQQSIASIERKVAEAVDTCRRLDAQFASFEKLVDESTHQTRGAEARVNDALKEAVKAATRAAESAAVYEKLKNSQPDFRKDVQGLERRLAEVRDEQTEAKTRHEHICQRLDEFEIVAEDYGETKGTVTAIDKIVGDLNTASKRQRSTGINGQG